QRHGENLKILCVSVSLWRFLRVSQPVGRVMPRAASALPHELAAALDRARERVNDLGGLGSTILYFPTIGSTNDVALALAAQGDRDGAIVIADEQTAGRGRRGRTWFSPPGSGVYVSVVLAPGRARSDPARATTLLTVTVGVALVEAIEAMTALRVDIKWPNDLVVARRKLAGILAESTGSAAAPAATLVIGYGINVNATA